MSLMQFESVDPATGKRTTAHAPTDSARLDGVLEDATVQATHWAERPISERAALLERVATALESRRDELADRVTSEMGKLTREALAEVDKCAWVCRYYAAHAAAFLADEEVASGAERSLIVHQPLGVLLAVMPWNFPFWQVFRFAAPAIAAGDVVLLKHASNVVGCGQAIADLFEQAGAPTGLFSHLVLSAQQVGQVIADRRVRGVTLTGSDTAGRAVASAAGKALKKSVLELGGSDPFVVLEDADLERTVDKAVLARFMNAGQSRIAAKRFIVVDAVADAFLQRLVNRVARLRPGDPRDPDTDIAPMARADLRDTLHAQVEDAIARGARLLTGGRAWDGGGFFYMPTVLTGVKPGMRAYSEELFGPVATVFRVPDEATALRLANDTPFGLGGSVWTRDRERGLAFARRLECGCAFVNELVKSDPRLPFGGIKASGYGRELSRLGIHEFVNSKTIWVD